jgi:hypothetical protein
MRRHFVGGVPRQGLNVMTQFRSELDSGGAAADDHQMQVGAGRNRHEDPAAQPVAEEQRLPDVVDEVTVLNDAGCSKIVRAAADRKDQCIVGKRPAGKLFPVRHRNGAELDSFSAPTQAREFPRPVPEVVPLRMRDETNVLVGVVGSSRCESMQHRFPDMGEVVIDEQNVGQLAARQPPAQVGCCDNPSDPATYHNDTVHISCPSTSFLPRMGEVKQEPGSLTCNRFNVLRRITEIWGAGFGMSREFFRAGTRFAIS